MKLLSELELAWAAGVFDHHGARVYRGPGVGRPHVTITFKGMEVAQRFERTLAPRVRGHIYTYSNGQTQYKATGHSNVEDLVDMLAPFTTPLEVIENDLPPIESLLWKPDGESA